MKKNCNFGAIFIYTLYNINHYKNTIPYSTSKSYIFASSWNISMK